MTALRLRCVDAAQVALRHAAGKWRRHGLDVNYHAPHDPVRPLPEASYFTFRATGTTGTTSTTGTIDQDGAPGIWQGMIGRDEWLSNAAPGLAALAAGALGADYVAQLFKATPRPLSIQPSLDYSALQMEGDIAGADLAGVPLVSLNVPEGTLWLRSLPLLAPLAPALPLQQTSPAPNPRTGHILDIPLTLQFLLGDSRLSHHCLARVSLGDVLLVTRQALRMRYGNLVLGSYLINEEGIIVNELMDEPVFDPQDAVEDDGASTASTASIPAADEAAPASAAGASRLRPAGLSRIPVRLEFVLQKTMLSFGELGDLQSGQVIALDALAEKQVLLMANGVPVGRGELIQLEDRLGIEMLEIYGSGGHAD